MSSAALVLSEVALVNMLGAMSPGPAFVMVSRTAAGQSRATAFALTAGVTSAVLAWGAATLFGVQLLMLHALLLYRTLQLAGALYLLWLGLMAWRHARGAAARLAQVTAAAPRSGPRSFLFGFAMNLGNPKLIAYFTSIFAAIVPAAAPLALRAGALAIVGATDFAWYCLVVLAFSSAPMQRTYRRFAGWIERLAGTAMIGFSLRILAGLRG
ncbi:MAG: LysE family transporter [Acetobacteraceae bacterium]